MAWLLGKPNPSLVRTTNNGNAPKGKLAPFACNMAKLAMQRTSTNNTPKLGTLVHLPQSVFNGYSEC